jgi:hypothetical protein
MHRHKFGVAGRSLCPYFMAYMKKRQNEDEIRKNVVQITHKQTQSKDEYPFGVVAKQNLIRFINDQTHCLLCYSRVVVIQCVDYGPFFALHFVCINPNCRTIQRFRSTENGTLDNKHFTAAWQLSGMDHKELLRFSALFGLCPISKQTFQRISNETFATAERLATISMEEELTKAAIRSMQSQLWQLTTEFLPEISAHIYSYVNPFGVFLPFHVSFDGRYSSRRNAYECTVTFINRIGGNIMQRYHVIRRRSNDTREGQLFVGAAKCAEGYAINEIINSLQQRLIFGQLKCFFLTYCHDHDSSASKLVEEKQNAFMNASILAENETTADLIRELSAPLSNSKNMLPTPLDLHDKNHAAVNAGKGASKIWVGFGCQTSRAFSKCCNKRDRTLSERQAMLRNYPNHWAGKHEHCINCDTSKKPIIDC